MKTTFLSFILVLFSLSSIGQVAKSIDTSAIKPPKNVGFNYKQLIIPTVLIGYGFVGLNSGDLKQINLDIRQSVVDNNYSKTTLDNYIQYAPALSVYALNNLGVQGKNNLKDRSVILATSMAFVFTSVTTLKKITKIERPDASADNSFPSGHTALAFAGAEFLYQEYKDKSVWYGISGYMVATATGALRIINNRHWLTDVATGAGIGILSTKAAYWFSPYLNKHIFPSMTGKTTAMFVPTYNGKQMEVAFVMNF